MVGQCSRQTLMLEGSSKSRRNVRLCVMRRGVCILAHAICFIFVQLSTIQFVFILQPFCPVTLQFSVGKITQTQKYFQLTTNKNNRIESSIESKTGKISMSTVIQGALSVHKLLSLCQRAGGQPSTVGLNFNGFWLRRMYVHNLGL